MAEILIGIVGLLGAFGTVSMYFLLERGKVDGNSLLFYSVNGASSVLIIISSAYHYDSGDIGAVVMESAWLIVSLMGIFRLKSKKEVK